MQVVQHLFGNFEVYTNDGRPLARMVNTGWKASGWHIDCADRKQRWHRVSCNVVGFVSAIMVMGKAARRMARLPKVPFATKAVR